MSSVVIIVCSVPKVQYFAARPVWIELSQQLLLLQSDTRHHAAVCRPPQISDSWHMHPGSVTYMPELTCDLYSSMILRTSRRGRSAHVTLTFIHTVTTVNYTCTVISRR